MLVSEEADEETELPTTDLAGGVRGKKRKKRSDKDYCSDEHRSKWNYHYGTGKSSKDARKLAGGSGKTPVNRVR